METLVKCKTCGKEVPQTEILKHYSTEHSRRGNETRESKADIGKTEDKLQADTAMNPGQVAVMEKEPETPPPAPETKPAPASGGETQHLSEAEPPETEERDKVEITTVRTAGIFRVLAVWESSYLPCWGVTCFPFPCLAKRFWGA